MISVNEAMIGWIVILLTSVIIITILFIQNNKHLKANDYLIDLIDSVHEEIPFTKGIYVVEGPDVPTTIFLTANAATAHAERLIEGGRTATARAIVWQV